VLIHGQNFIINYEDVVKPYGFYVTRFVKAQGHDQAEEIAVQMIRDLDSLREMVENPEDDRPEMVIEETEELESFEGIKNLSPEMAWYDPDEDEEDESQPEAGEDS
jgi:hypothetical protein